MSKVGGFKCPKCYGETKVDQTRWRAAPDHGYTRRRRECKLCKYRFTTIEQLYYTGRK